MWHREQEDSVLRAYETQTQGDFTTDLTNPNVLIIIDECQV